MPYNGVTEGSKQTESGFFHPAILGGPMLRIWRLEQRTAYKSETVNTAPAFLTDHGLLIVNDDALFGDFLFPPPKPLVPQKIQILVDTSKHRRLYRYDYQRLCSDLQTDLGAYSVRVPQFNTNYRWKVPGLARPECQATPVPGADYRHASPGAQ